MEIKHLEHRHGGKITALHSVCHDTHAHGELKGVAFWYYLGDVTWGEGSETKCIEISPNSICFDHNDDLAKQEFMAANQKMVDYLARNGHFNNESGFWEAKVPRGSERLEQVKPG